MSSLLINHQSSALYLFVIVLLLIMVIIVHIWSSLKSKAWQLPAPARVCVALYSRFTRVVWYTYILLLYCICTRIADEWFEISIYIYSIYIIQKLDTFPGSNIYQHCWSTCLPTGSSQDLINSLGLMWIGIGAVATLTLAHLEKVMAVWWRWTSSPESSKIWSDSPVRERRETWHSPLLK